MQKNNNGDCKNAKLEQLERFTVAHSCGKLTTDQGVGVPNTDDSLKAGMRGPTLMEDFIFREKITHFDHERIPERVVHARGFGAHGYFQVYESLSEITKAQVFCDPSCVTPVFVRFSTVAGSRGSADTVRDIRGFAVKFYTQEGNYDLVANNTPVFFIQDAIKFPDLIHAVKPEPQNEIPQAQSAHDTFWDFVSNTPETLHNVMWLMSDRAIPRSFRMMEGFGIHTFRFVNCRGESKFVKFHWKPLLGVHSLVWDETQKIAGKDPDFNRRDLFDAIECGNYPQWELGIQVLDPRDEFKFDFDILDATKLWPEELIPVKRVGKMTLNKNVTNFFAETEQVAFCPANIVPGIDFTNDPLLQGRLFSYLDTQISRLGGPNFHQIPINHPIVPVNNNHRDAMHRMTIDAGQVTYSPNSLQNNQPHPATEGESGFTSYPEKVEGHKIRMRSKSFMDFYSQPAMVFESLTGYERQHIIDAYRFELGKVKSMAVRQSVVNQLSRINETLALEVAKVIGVCAPKSCKTPANVFKSPALSMANTVFSAKTLKVAILAENGFCLSDFKAVTSALHAKCASFDVISKTQGNIASDQGACVQSDQTYETTASVLYDALYIPGGAHIKMLTQNGTALHFINETFKHFKPIGASGDALEAIKCSQIGCLVTLAKPGCIHDDCGVVTSGCGANMAEFADVFTAALAKMRFFARAPKADRVQA